MPNDYAPFHTIRLLCMDAVSKTVPKGCVVWAPRSWGGHRVGLVVAPKGASTGFTGDQTALVVAASDGEWHERVLGGDGSKPVAMRVHPSYRGIPVVLCLEPEAVHRE